MKWHTVNGFSKVFFNFFFFFVYILSTTNVFIVLTLKRVCEIIIQNKKSLINIIKIASVVYSFFFC